MSAGTPQSRYPPQAVRHSCYSGTCTCMRFKISLSTQLACRAHGIYGSAGGATQQSPLARMRSAEMIWLHCRPSAVPHSCCSGTCACTCCSCVSMYYVHWESKPWKALAEPMGTFSCMRCIEMLQSRCLPSAAHHSCCSGTCMQNLHHDDDYPWCVIEPPADMHAAELVPSAL